MILHGIVTLFNTQNVMGTRLTKRY